MWLSSSFNTISFIIWTSNIMLRFQYNATFSIQPYFILTTLLGLVVFVLWGQLYTVPFVRWFFLLVYVYLTVLPKEGGTLTLCMAGLLKIVLTIPEALMCMYYLCTVYTKGWMQDTEEWMQDTEGWMQDIVYLTK